MVQRVGGLAVVDRASCQQAVLDRQAIGAAITNVETFFAEQRPFFLEGTGIYSFQVNCNVVNCNNEGLFYSRRIGRSRPR